MDNCPAPTNLPKIFLCKRAARCMSPKRGSSTVGKAKGGCSREQSSDYGTQGSWLSRVGQSWTEPVAVFEVSAVALLHHSPVWKAFVAQWSLYHYSPLAVSHLGYMWTAFGVCEAQKCWVYLLMLQHTCCVQQVLYFQSCVEDRPLQVTFWP